RNSIGRMGDAQMHRGWARRSATEAPARQQRQMRRSGREDGPVIDARSLSIRCRCCILRGFGFRKHKLQIAVLIGVLTDPTSSANMTFAGAGSPALAPGRYR